VPIAGHWVGSSLSIPNRGIVQPRLTNPPPSAAPNAPQGGLGG